MKLRRAVSGLLLGLVLAQTVQAWAAGPMDLVPENASFVVRLKSPEQTIVKVGNYANAGVPGVGFLIQGQAPALGVLISNPTLGGVDLKQDWYLAVFAQKNAQPQVVFIIPTTDKDALTEAVGTNFSFVTSGNWIAYSEDEAATELVKACKDGKSKSLKLDDRAAAIANESELSVYANLTQVRETYAAEFENADKQLEEGLENIKTLTAGLGQQAQGINIDAVWDFYGKLGHGLIQGARDAESFSLGLKFADANLVIEELFLVKKGTKSDLLLQKNQPSELTVLNKLPQDRAGYFAVHGDTKGMMKWAMDLAGSMFGDNADAKAKLDKFAAGMNELKFGSIGGTFGLGTPGSEGIVSGVIVSEVTPADQMLKLSRDMSQNYKLDLPGIKQEIVVKEGAEKVGDVSVDIINVKQEVSEEADPLHVQKQLMEVMYGKNGMTQRLAAVKDHVIQTVGGGNEGMKIAIDSVNASASSTGTSALSKSRARQIPKANLIGMVDLPNFALKAVLTANEVAGKGDVPPLPIPLPAAQLKALKIAPSYLTFAVGTEPEGLRLRTELPAATIQGFFKIYQTFQAAQNAPR